MKRLCFDQGAEIAVAREQELGERTQAAVEDVIHRAFGQLTAQWLGSEHELSSRVEAAQHEDGQISCRGVCDVLQGACVQMHFWSKSNDLMIDEVSWVGASQLESDERVIGVYTLPIESFLVLSLHKERTVVSILHMRRHLGDIQAAKIKTLGRSASTSAFDARERVLMLTSDSGECSLYRFDERYRAIEPLDSLDLTTKTTLEMPLRCATLVKNMLHLVDRDGVIQSLNIRNQQCSRPIGTMPPGPSTLFHLCDGQVLAG